MPSPEIHDTIIIGGGPAGVSCALELIESRIDCLLFDKAAALGGQLSQISNSIRNLSAGYWETGEALRRDLEQVSTRMSLNATLDTEVTQADLKTKRIEAGGRNYSARALLLCTGYRIRKVEIEGMAEAKAHIIYDAEAHEEVLTGRKIAIIGGGDNALMDALWLADIGCTVKVIHRSKEFKARPDVLEESKDTAAIELLTEAEVRKVYSRDGKLDYLDVLRKDKETLEKLDCEYLLIKVGYAPNTELFLGQIDMENGHIPIDAACRTQLDGIFAAGDIVTPGYPRIASAIGHGMLAAASIREYLSA